MFFENGTICFAVCSSRKRQETPHKKKTNTYMLFHYAYILKPIEN